MKYYLIIDKNFAHTSYSSLQSSNKFKWSRVIKGNETETVVVTDYFLTSTNLTNMYAWLLEPPVINPLIYSKIKDVSNRFKKVFTCIKSLLDLGEPYYFIPCGGCWIKPSDQQIYIKTKNLSIISSSKKSAPGHKLRHEIIRRTNKNDLDVFGKGYRYIQDKIEGHKDYRFSIVVENSKIDYYFTEKLIDSFATGCIPIYWGCPSISDFFNIDGMILFNNIDELLRIIPTLNSELYNAKIEAIQDNYNRCKRYMLADDHIYDFFNI